MSIAISFAVSFTGLGCACCRGTSVNDAQVRVDQRCHRWREKAWKKSNRAAVDLLMRHLAALVWTREAAEHCEEIRADLKKKGQLIGSHDLLIAAHARSVGAAVVTNNLKDFGRVKGLKVENWMA